MYISKYAISAAFMLCLGSLLVSGPVFAQSAGVNSTSGDLPIGANGNPFMWMGGGGTVPTGSVYFGSTTNPTVSIDSQLGTIHLTGKLGVGIGSANPTSSFEVGAVTSTAGATGQAGTPVVNFTVDGSTGNVTTNGNIASLGSIVIGSSSIIGTSGWGMQVRVAKDENFVIDKDGNSSSVGAVGISSVNDTNGAYVPLTITSQYTSFMVGNVGIGPGMSAPTSLLTIGFKNNPYFTVDVVGNVTAYAYYHSSDMRLKSDIHPIENALDKLMQIRGVEFNWKRDGRPDMGVVAQDVAKVFPNVVSHGADGKGMMAVEYDSLAGPMIESIRELKMENDAMKAQLNEISASVKALKEENSRLRSVRVDSTHNSIKASSVLEP